MATWKTGRTRTLVLSGTMAGDFSFCIDTEPVGQPTATHSSEASGTMLVAWGAFGAIVTWQQAPTVPSVGGNHFYGTRVTANDGQGHSGSDQAGNYIHQTSGAGINIDWELSATGHWSFSCDVEEWATTYTPTTSSVISGTPFPEFGGAAQADGLPATGIQYYEVPRIGGVLAVHVDFGGASVTLSNPITSIFPIGYVQIGTITGNVFGASNVYSTNSSLEFDAGVDLPSQVWTETDSSGSSAITYVAQTMQLQTTNVPGAPAGGHGTASGATQPKTGFGLQARLTCFGQDFPSAGKNLRIQTHPGDSIDLTLNPTNSTHWAQNFYDIAATLQGVNVGPLALDERGPVACWLTDLTPDDSRDWRTPFHGFHWDALSLSRDPQVDIDDCTSATHWTAGDHTTLSIIGGQLVATASGGTGSLTVSVPSTVRVWEAYRYLQVIGTFDPGSTISPPPILSLSVSIASQTWDLLLSRTMGAKLLDLCCATNETSLTEDVQSRFPLKDPGGFPIAEDPTHAYKLGWGVQFCDSITFGGIPDGWSVTLGGITLTSSLDRDRQSSITLLEPFQNFFLGWTSPSDNTFLQPYLLIEADGRVCDLPALAHVVPTSGSDSYVWFSISQMQSMLAYMSGLHASLLPDPSDGYHDSTLPTLLLGGEGATYTWSSNLWTDWVDRALGEVLVAQDLWDECSVYPGAGEVWSQAGAYGATIPLRVSKSLRAQAWGLVFDTKGNALRDAPVEIYETATPTSIEGTADSNRLGWYLTEAPWARGNVPATIELESGPLPHLVVAGTPQNRSRLRGSFRFLLTGDAKGYDVSQSFRHVRTVVSASRIVIGIAGNALPQSWRDVDSGLTGSWARPRFADHGPLWPIGLFYGDGSNCWFARSFDEGQTWTVEVDMATGAVGDFEEGANGIRWFYKLLSSDGGTTFDIWGKVLDAQLNVVQDWTLTDLTGVDNAPIAVRESPGFDGSWRIGLLYSASSVPTVKFSLDGLHFS